MINSAVLKLTAWYVSALFVVSLVFSFILFEVNAREIERNSLALPSIGAFQDSTLRAQFREDNENRYEESVQRLVQNIVFLNICTLLFGSFFSYLLARLTLQPVKEAMESQSRFASDASHELRTPLASMQTEIEVTLRDPKTSKEEYKKLLESNLEEIQAMKNMSSALLQLTRGDEAARQQFTPLSLTEVLTQAVKRILVTAKQKNISINNTSRLVLPQINGDRQSLIELFVILLDNAIKYSHEKTVIDIDYKLNGRYITVSVSDHGAGISKQDMPHIFDRFYRSDASRTKVDTPGYGLGLSIAKQIADIHQVKFNVESNSGEKTVFSLTFHQL